MSSCQELIHALKDGSYDTAFSRLYPSSAPENARELLQGEGALRVHGGGFAGTIQAFVPRNKLNGFISDMETLLAPRLLPLLADPPCGRMRSFAQTVTANKNKPDTQHFHAEYRAFWSCYPDLNWRPHPYQGCALPTEL